MSIGLSDLPSEIVIEILLFAAYQDLEFARSLLSVSPWTYKLAQRAIFSTINVLSIGDLRRLFNTAGLVKGPFPRIPANKVVDLFRLSFKHFPDLFPTHDARDRGRLVNNLWLIPLDGQDRITNFEDHIYSRLLLQLDGNVHSLALAGATFQHFLMNKADHFRDVRDLHADATNATGWCAYPYLTHLMLLDATPALIMEGQYARADDCAKVFRRITHFTTYGYFHSIGLPVPIHHFASLTHVALPLIPNQSVMQGDGDPTCSAIFANTGGWDLLQSSAQIQMMVFLFHPNGRLYVGSHMSNLWIPCSPVELILSANRLHRKAYALPIDGLRGLQRQWYTAARGGPSIWELAEDALRRSPLT